MDTEMDDFRTRLSSDIRLTASDIFSLWLKVAVAFYL